jgi:hypothetical protein
MSWGTESHRTVREGVVDHVVRVVNPHWEEEDESSMRRRERRKTHRGGCSP